MSLARSPINLRSRAGDASDTAPQPMQLQQHGHDGEVPVGHLQYLERMILEQNERNERMMERMVAVAAESSAAVAAVRAAYPGLPVAAAMNNAAPEATNVQRAPSPAASHRSWDSQNSFSSRALAKELFKRIPDFTGDGASPLPLIEFINKVDAYLRNAMLTPLQECEMVASKFTITAHTWWYSKTPEERPQCWLQLRAALLQHFMPPEFVTTVLDQLTALVQTASVADYNSAFNKLAIQLSTEDITAVILRYFYCKGLKRPIYSAIINQKHRDLNALQSAAIAQEQMTTARETRAQVPPGTVVEAHLGDSENPATGPSTSNNNRGARGQGRKPRERKEIQPCKWCDQLGHYTAHCTKMLEAKAREKKDGAHPTKAEAHLTLSTNYRSSHSIALDTCATQHIVKDIFLLSDVKTIPATTLTGLTGASLCTTKAGTLTIENPDNPALRITLTDVLYVPTAQRNLVSTAPLLEAGYAVYVGPPASSILKDGNPILHLCHHGNLPFIEGFVDTPASAFVSETEKEGTGMSLNYGTNALGTSDNARFKLRI
ncbi:hypothetical protein HDU86_001937 [Geranomyces michiganensis]|nr:hypothetical protein HDU86_001937 [Geranomyces michiganensis]